MTQAGLQHSPDQLFKGPRLLGTIAWACIAFTLLVTAFSVLPVLRAMTATAAVQGSPVPDKEAALRHTAFEGGLVVSDQRIDARAPFGITRPPVAEKPKTSVPTRYGGSAIVGVVNDTVLLADGRRIAVGAADGDVEVVSLDLPWSVTVRWMGGEFPVNLFERGTVNLEQPLTAIIGGLPYIAPPPAPKVASAPPPPAPAAAAAASAAAPSPPLVGTPLIIQSNGQSGVVLTLPAGSTPAQPVPPPPPPDE